MTIEVLREYGLERMDDEQIRDFLINEGMGVLGLPTADTPYLIPMSFGYDAASRLYFSFFVGEDSRKVELSEQAEAASFLAFSADSTFSWESVLLTGTLGELPRAEWDDHEDALENAWHLDLLAKADTGGELRIYEFQIDEQVGLRSVGLPPALERERLSEGAN